MTLSLLVAGHLYSCGICFRGYPPLLFYSFVWFSFVWHFHTPTYRYITDTHLFDLSLLSLYLVKESLILSYVLQYFAKYVLY